jgi:Ca2+ transporting ATPase
MGTGCPAAKDASQLVITDNNFQGCLQAVLWGRNIFQNVTRFLQFQLTCNGGLMLTVFIGICFFGESPFCSSQLLWINMIMDVLAALALATEPPMVTQTKGNPKNQTSLLKQPHVWR